MNVPLLLLAAAVALPGVLFPNPAAAASTTSVYSAQGVYLFGIPVDFILFGLTLLAVAVFHHKTLEVALTGLRGK
jgi:membrane protein implicated in regulation of membrane protease activity